MCSPAGALRPGGISEGVHEADVYCVSSLGKEGSCCADPETGVGGAFCRCLALSQCGGRNQFRPTGNPIIWSPSPQTSVPRGGVLPVAGGRLDGDKGESQRASCNFSCTEPG